MNRYCKLLSLSALIFATVTVAKDPVFHLKNNSKFSIKVVLYDKNANPIDAIERMAEPNTVVKVETLDNGLSKIKISYPFGIGTRAEAQYQFNNTTGATVYYLKYTNESGEGKLLPQKGNIFNRSTKGYNLKNNIKASQIKDI